MSVRSDEMHQSLDLILQRKRPSKDWKEVTLLYEDWVEMYALVQDAINILEEHEKRA